MLDLGLDDVQNATHGVRPRLWTRAPSTLGGWIEMKVVDSPTVTYARAGELPGRTLDATVTLDSVDGRLLTQSQDWDSIDWLSAPLSPFGSWVRAEQAVTDQNGTVHVVPWGVYRVDGMTLNEAQSTVQITGSDVFSQVDDRKLVQLAMGRVRPADSISTVITRMISEALTAGITPWWGAVFSRDATIPDRTYGSVNGNGTLFRDDRTAALLVLAANLTPKDPGGGLISPRTTCKGVAGWTSGPAVQLIKRRDPARGVAEVSVAANLVFGDVGDSVDRDDLFNEVAATYELSRPVSGGTRTYQRRYLAQYDDAGQELRGSGPFGWVSLDSLSVDMPDTVLAGGEDAYVKSQATAAIGAKFYATREVTVSCGPIYGLEQGDQVMLRIDDPDRTALSCELVAATIPLGASGGAWQLTLLASQLLDVSWAPKYFAPVNDASDVSPGNGYEFSWKRYNPNNGTTLDLTEGHGTKGSWRGWTVTGARSTKGGSGLTVTSSGTSVTLTSGYGWKVNQGHYRYLGKADVTALTDAQQARAGLESDLGDITWGEWTSVAKRSAKTKAKTVTVEAPVPPAAATSMRLIVQVQNMITGGQVRLNAAEVDYGVLKKS
jgi:hypothetical protein